MGGRAGSLEVDTLFGKAVDEMSFGFAAGFGVVTGGLAGEGEL